MREDPQLLRPGPGPFHLARRKIMIEFLLQSAVNTMNNSWRFMNYGVNQIQHVTLMRN